MEAGTIVAFHQAQWHAAPPNYSDIERKNVYISFCPTWMKPLDREFPNILHLSASPPPLFILSYFIFYILFFDILYLLKAYKDLHLKLAGCLANQGEFFLLFFSLFSFSNIFLVLFICLLLSPGPLFVGGCHQKRI